MSSSGQYRFVSLDEGTNYVSSDFGENWTESFSSNTTLTSISLSSSGQYQTAVCILGYIYVTTNFGTNWSPRDSERDWKSVCVSSSGQYQTAVASSNYIYVSTDFGMNWSQRDSEREWNSVCMSASGQYQTALEAEGCIYVSTDFGSTWLKKDSQDRNWLYVSMSASGQYQTAICNYPDSVYISADFGNTWTTKFETAFKTLTSVAVSASGQYQVICDSGDGNGSVYASIDFGNNWNVLPSGNKSWMSIAISGSGQYVTVCSQEVIYSFNSSTDGSGDGSGIIKDDILLFVDDLGSDGNSGLNDSSPLKTLTKAFDIIAQTGWNNTAIIKIVNKVSLQNEISPVVLNSGVKGQQKNQVCITGNVELYKTVESNDLSRLEHPYNTGNDILLHYLISSNDFITDDIGSYITFDSGIPNTTSYNFISEVKYSSQVDSICAYVNDDLRGLANLTSSQQINVFKNTSILEFDNNTLHFKSPITIRNLNIQSNDFLYTEETNKHYNYLYFTGQQKINLSGINFNIQKLNRSLLNLKKTVLYNNIEIINVDCVITTGCSKIPLYDNIFYSNDSNLGIMVVSEIIEKYDGINFNFNNMPDATTNLYNSSCHMRRTKIPPSESEESAILSRDFLPTFINCNLSLFSAYGPYRLKFENINMSLSEVMYYSTISSSISDDNLNFEGKVEINNSKIIFKTITFNIGALMMISKSQVEFSTILNFIDRCQLNISNFSTVLMSGMNFYNNVQSNYAIEISDSNLKLNDLFIINTIENNSNGVHLNNSTLKVENVFSNLFADKFEFGNNNEMSNSPNKPLIIPFLAENNSTINCKDMGLLLSTEKETVKIQNDSKMNVSKLYFFYNTTCSYNEQYCALKLVNNASLNVQYLRITGENNTSLPSAKPNGIIVSNNCTFNVDTLSLDKLISGITTIVSEETIKDSETIINIGSLTATNIYGYAISSRNCYLNITEIKISNCISGINIRSSKLKSKTITLTDFLESTSYSLEIYNSSIDVDTALLRSKLNLSNSNCVFRNLNILCNNTDNNPSLVFDGGSLNVCRLSSYRFLNADILGSTNTEEIKITNGTFTIIKDGTTLPWISVLGGITLTNASMIAPSSTSMVVYIGGSIKNGGSLDINSIISPTDLKYNWEFSTTTPDKICLTAINSNINAIINNVESEFAGGGKASISLDNSIVKFNGGFTSQAYSNQISHVVIDNNSSYEENGNTYKGNTTGAGIDIIASKCILNKGKYSGESQTAIKCSMMSDIIMLDYSFESSIPTVFDINNGSIAKLSKITSSGSFVSTTALSILKGSSVTCANISLVGNVQLGTNLFTDLPSIPNGQTNNVTEGCLLIKIS